MSTRERFAYTVVGIDDHDASWIVSAAADLLDAITQLPEIQREPLHDEYGELYEAMQAVGYTAQFPDMEDEEPMNYIDDIAKAIWNELSPENQGDRINWPLYRNYALLVLTTGTKTNLEHVHDAWSAWCAGVRPDHPSLIPFPLLSDEIQDKGEPYNLAIIEVASRIKENLKSRYESDMENE